MGEFSGASGPGGSSRSGPVQFQKEVDDPFGLDAFLDIAKRQARGAMTTGTRGRTTGTGGGAEETERGGRITTELFEEKLLMSLKEYCRHCRHDIYIFSINCFCCPA